MKQRDYETLYSTFYLNSKAETIINNSDIDYVFKSFYSTIISNIQKSLGQRLGRIINSVTDHNINNSKYNPLAGSSFVKLLINNIQNNIWLIFKILKIMNALYGV